MKPKKVPDDLLESVLKKKWRQMYEEMAAKDEYVWIGKNGKVVRVKAKDLL